MFVIIWSDVNRAKGPFRSNTIWPSCLVCFARFAAAAACSVAAGACHNIFSPSPLRHPFLDIYYYYFYGLTKASFIHGPL